MTLPNALCHSLTNPFLFPQYWTLNIAERARYKTTVVIGLELSNTEANHHHQVVSKPHHITPFITDCMYRKTIIESMSMVPTVRMDLEWSCCIVLHSTKPDRERHRMWGHRGEAGVVLYSLSLCGDLLALRMTALLMDGLFPSLVAQQNVSENMCARDGWWEAARQNYWG